MRRLWFIVFVTCGIFFLSLPLTMAQSVVQKLHAAEAGNVEGGQVKAIAYSYAYVDVLTAGSWDGALNWETYGGLEWTSGQCKNMYTCVSAATATVSGRYACELYGSWKFRARIDGRTQGTVDVSATFFEETVLASVRPCSGESGGGSSFWTGDVDNITFQPVNDSTLSVQVLDVAGSSVLNVDTTNQKVGIEKLVVDDLTFDGNTISSASTDIVLSPGSGKRVHVTQLRNPSGTLFLSTSGGDLDINVGSYKLQIRGANVNQFAGATYNGLEFRANTVNGSILSGEDLNLQSTSHATKGTVNVLDDLVVADGSYAQFEDNNAGTPPSADCDSDTERGRQSIDTTNNRLYICNGATRGWDYIALTD